MRTDALEVGDRVLVAENYGYYGRRHVPGTVMRKTPSGIVTVEIDASPQRGTIAYQKVFGTHGWERGNRIRWGQLQMFDEKVLADEDRALNLRRKRDKLESSKLWRDLPDDVILQVAEIVEAAEKEAKNG